MNNNIDSIVKSLLKARSTNHYISNDNIDLIPNNIKDAYLIQNKVHVELDKTKDKTIGRKIGCTTEVMQSYLGIEHPCAGTLREKNCYNSGVYLNFDNFNRVGVECELAVKLSNNLIFNTEPNIYDIHNSIEYFFPAIEIVDDRYSNWKNFSVSHLIADDFFNAGCVLGLDRYQEKFEDIGITEGSMYINNNKIGTGRGNNILGNPFNAIKWLVSQKEIIGSHLRKNSIILLGSLVETFWINRGDKVQINISGMGSVSVKFE